VGVPSEQLGPEHVGNYYTFSVARVPEAFKPFHQAFYPPRPAHQQRKGGCRGLQAEFAATGAPQLMWRAATARLAGLVDAAGAPGAPPLRALIGGPRGAGKSVALAALVERARGRGEVVLYIPDATALVRGGFFYRRAGGEGYDTIISAQHVLKSVADSHKDALARLPLAPGAPQPRGVGEGATLLDVATAGTSTDDDVSHRPAALGGGGL
jgi:hypothetical protein